MLISSHIPPLQTLRVFEAAVRLRSFTRAADELALTQGAVSQHVRTLEAHTGVALFERTREGAVPTRHAQTLALQVRQGLRVLERAFAKPRTRADAGRGSAQRELGEKPVRLTLSMLAAFAARWLEPRLERFHRSHPQIELELRTGAALARFDSRDRVDVALRYGPGKWPGLHAEKLMDEWVFPVASPQYRDGKLPRRRADLARCTLLRHRWQPWELWLQAAGLDMTEPPDGPEYEDANELLDAAARGEGIALARRSLVQADLDAGRLVRLWRVSVLDVHAYYIVWRPDCTKLAAIDSLREWLHDEARQCIAAG